MNATKHGTLVRQRGFSLIEVLVSMFIVSLGILALTGLMQASSRYGKTSELRSMATLLANDIADHIRANSLASDPVTKNSGYTLDKPYSTTPAYPVVPNPTCTPKCSPAELAALDVDGWLRRVNVTLPGGNGYMKYNAPTAVNQRGSVDVWVAWTDPVPNVKNERTSTECAVGFAVDSNYAVRCVYLQVGL